ncbi:MAG: 3-oxoadipate enol-lactonase [Acidobacteriaceae bacterium]|jgi:3-oxoadipate enol-lactonase
MAVAEVGSVRLHYRIEGAANGSVLVLIHSLGTDLSMWDGVAANLARDHRVLRFDLRGHGASSVPSGPWRLADFGHDLLALLDTLDLASGDLAGTSLGGMIAMWIAIHAPTRAGRLILANTAARVGTREGWQARIADVRTASMAEVAKGAAERWFTSAFRESHPEEVTRLTHLLASSSEEGYIASCAALGDADLIANLSDIHAPALIVAGACDLVTTPADGRRLQQGIAGARYVELPGAHLCAAELPDPFSSAVREFLQETSHG